MSNADKDKFKAEVKRMASGRWGQILRSIGALTDAHLSGRHGPCPKCGGNDRFRALDDFHETGGLICNQCFNKGNSDGFSALQWLLDIRFPEALRRVADFVGVSNNGHHKAQQPARKKASPAADETLSASFLKGLQASGMERVHDLAESLNVSHLALEDLGVGYLPDQNAWTWPEREADGKVCGINRRFEDGSKKVMQGHSRGLYYQDGWQEHEGPILIVEGGSDTAAGITIGLSTIGRPSAIVPRGLLPELVELLRTVSNLRPIIVLGERDQKANGDWPGKDGAIRTAKELTEALGREVKWALPPKDVKDLRAWIRAEPEKSGHELLAGLVFEAEADGMRFCGKSAGELWDQATEPVRWLVADVISCDQPTIFGAKQKTLKTTLLADLVVSLASKYHWLGKFEIPERKRVLLLTGESSEAAAIRKVRRAAEARNLRREDIGDWIRIEAIAFPNLPSDDDCATIRKVVEKFSIEVVLLDPLYMGLQGVNTANLAEVGPAMRRFMEACRPANLIIAHHVKKSASFDDAPNLEDLSQAGIAEFAGNYWLMGRMSEYTGDGLHQLAIRYGGRDEQFGLLKLEFDERSWEARFTSLIDHREDQQNRRETEKVNALTQRILVVLKRHPDGITEAKLASALSTKAERMPFQTALEELEERSAIVRIPDFKAGNKAVCTGWRLPHE